MKRIITITALALALMITVSCTTYRRKVSDPLIQKRIDGLEQRTSAGALDGSLSVREQSGIRMRLEKLTDMGIRLKADGTLTDEEREKLNRQIDRLSNIIYNKRRNRDWRW